MILELADEFEHLQGVKTKIRHQLAVGCGLDWAPSQAFHNRHGFPLEAVGIDRTWGRGCAGRGTSAHRIFCVGQAEKCNMNVTCCATRHWRTSSCWRCKQFVIRCRSEERRVGK